MAKIIDTNQEENSSSVETKEFEIDWPDGLKIDPVFRVKISKTRSVYVYEEDVPEITDAYGRTIKAYKHWRCVIVLTRNGRPPMTGNSIPYGDWYGKECRNLLEVRLYIDAYAREMQPKTKTVKQKVVLSVEDDE